MKNQKLSEEKEARQPQKRSRARRIAGEFVPRVIDTDAIKEGATMVRGLWDQLADRQRHLAKKRDSDEECESSDFDTLCAENEMGEKELAERKAAVLRSKRLSWIFMICMVVWSLLGVTAMVIQGLGWVPFTIVILSMPLAMLFFAWNFRYSVHLWQLERKELAGVHEFLKDGGIGRLLRY